MLYTCSISAKKIVGNKRHYTIVLGYGNNEVAPDKHDIDLLKKGVMTARGFALNYEVKLRSPEAYEWMARVSEEASHEDVVLIGEEGSEKSYRIILAEMMASMFSGKTKFRYAGELR
jgi:hypothetical protein